MRQVNFRVRRGVEPRTEWLEILAKYGFSANEPAEINEDTYHALLKEYGFYDLRNEMMELIVLLKKRGYKSQNYKWLWKDMAKSISQKVDLYTHFGIMEKWVRGDLEEEIPDIMIDENYWESILSVKMYKYIQNMIKKIHLIKDLFVLNEAVDNNELMHQIKYAIEVGSPRYYPEVKVTPTKNTIDKIFIQFPEGVYERRYFANEKR